MYERSFGTLLRKAGDDTDRASPADYPNKQSKRNSKSSSSSEDDSKGKRKNVTFSESSPVGSDSSSVVDIKVAKKARAREQRVARRQARIEEEDAQPKRHADRSKESNSNKRSRVDDTNEEVIKVPMLTGTLYLYRGLNRRAEFVRKC